MSEDKDLPPSEKKLEKALDESQDEQSEEVTWLVTLVVLGGLFYVTIPRIVAAIVPLVRMEPFDLRSLDDLNRTILSILNPLATMAEVGALMLFGASLGAGLVGNVMNRRRPPGIKMPSISYDPVSQVTKLFEPSTLLSTLKLWVFAIAVIGIVCYEARDKLPLAVIGTYASPMSSFDLCISVLLSVVTPVLGVSVLSAIIDAIQKHLSFIKDNMMDEEEVKKENKEDNGNPEIKSKRMELMREG